LSELSDSTKGLGWATHRMFQHFKVHFLEDFNSLGGLDDSMGAGTIKQE